MVVRWSSFFVFLFLYRSLYSVAGQLVVTRFTSLGDAKRYQKLLFTITDLAAPTGQFDYTVTQIGTAITESIGAVLYIVGFGNLIMINIGFQAIAFVGIYRFLMATAPKVRKRLALLVMLPSFSLWSSVASKESLLVFCLGILCAYVVDMYYARERMRPFHVFAALLLFVIKPQFLIVVLYIFVLTKVARRVRERAVVAIGGSLLSLVPLYIFRDRIDAAAFDVLRHFAGQGRSTREAFWVERYDVFWKAPYGMFQGFFGPTLAEATSGNVLQLASFIESSVLVGAFLILLIRRLPRIPVYSFFASLFVTFWIVFPNYPIQIMNSGSAIRYRSGYLMLVFLAFAVLLSRELFVSWSSGAARRHS